MPILNIRKILRQAAQDHSLIPEAMKYLSLCEKDEIEALTTFLQTLITHTDAFTFSTAVEAVPQKLTFGICLQANYDEKCSSQVSDVLGYYIEKTVRIRQGEA